MADALIFLIVIVAFALMMGSLRSTKTFDEVATMSEVILLGVICLLIAIYLFFALIKPEKF